MKHHIIKKPLLRSVKSMDITEDDFLSSLSRVADSQLEETTRTNSQISKLTNHTISHPEIIEEIGRTKSSAALPKSVTRRHSEVSRNGELLSRLHDKDYSAKIVRHLHLKGHVKYLKKEDMVLFVCSPM